jgi:hypothetical protein
MEMRYHYVRDMVQRRAVILRYIPTDEQTVDVLTNPLSKTKFEYFPDKLGLVDNAPLTEVLKSDQRLVSFSWGRYLVRDQDLSFGMVRDHTWCTNPQSKIEGSLTRDSDL